MEGSGYYYFGDSYPNPDNLWITFENLADRGVAGDWSYAYSLLSPALKQICSDGGVAEDAASRGKHSRTSDLSQLKENARRILDLESNGHSGMEA